MKKLIACLSACAVLFSLAASADTLTLTDPSGIPVPSGAHVDAYPFPTPLLFIANPITNLHFTYQTIASPGEHEILSATLLFDPAQVSILTTVASTPTYYEANVKFSIPVTAVSNPFAPAFWAVHEDAAGGLWLANQLTWTATYLDGSQQTYGLAQIPEPSTLALIVVAGLLGFVARKGRSRHN